MLRNKFYTATLLLLSGCSSYKQTFDCPPRPGVGCKSIDQVNQMVNDNTLDDEICVKNEKCNSKIAPVAFEAQAFDQVGLENPSSFAKNNFPDYSEKSLRITLFPYKDEKSVYHTKREVIIN